MTELDDDEKAETQRKRLEIERIQAESDTQAVMATPAGRRWMWRLLEGPCRLHAGSYSGDALATAYAEGRRAVGIEVMLELQQVARDGYLRMVAETLDALASEPPT